MRRNFSKLTQRLALARSRGICECHLIPHVFKTPCGMKLGTGNTFFEHIDCDELGGDNSIDNCACLVRTCFKFKTKHYDRPSIDKAHRRFDRHHGITDPWKRKLPGGRASPFKLKIGGRGPVDRITGEPWGRG